MWKAQSRQIAPFYCLGIQKARRECCSVAQVNASSRHQPDLWEHKERVTSLYSVLLRSESGPYPPGVFLVGSLSTEIEISWKIKGKRFGKGERHHEEQVCVCFFPQYFPDVWYAPLSLESDVILFFFIFVPSLCLVKFLISYVDVLTQSLVLNDGRLRLHDNIQHSAGVDTTELLENN